MGESRPEELSLLGLEGSLWITFRAAVLCCMKADTPCCSSARTEVGASRVKLSESY